MGGGDWRWGWAGLIVLTHALVQVSCACCCVCWEGGEGNKCRAGGSSTRVVVAGLGRRVSWVEPDRKSWAGGWVGACRCGVCEDATPPPPPTTTTTITHPTPYPRAHPQAALAAGLLELRPWKPRTVGAIGVLASVMNCYMLCESCMLRTL